MAFVTLVVARWLEWELAQWVHPMKDRSDNPSHHERTFLPQSYISLPFQVQAHCPVTWNSIQNSGELAERAKQYITVDYYWLMRCSSMVECPLLVPWVVWSILHSEHFFCFFVFFFLLQQELHDRMNEFLWEMLSYLWDGVHLNDSLLLSGKSSSCGGRSRFPLSLWSFTICLMLYNWK